MFCTPQLPVEEPAAYFGSHHKSVVKEKHYSCQLLRFFIVDSQVAVFYVANPFGFWQRSCSNVTFTIDSSNGKVCPLVLVLLPINASMDR
jgi:hypothetical protein